MVVKGINDIEEFVKDRSVSICGVNVLSSDDLLDHLGRQLEAEGLNVEVLK